jgi:hypothetical protein
LVLISLVALLAPSCHRRADLAKAGTRHCVTACRKKKRKSARGYAQCPKQNSRVLLQEYNFATGQKKYAT